MPGIEGAGAGLPGSRGARAGWKGGEPRDRGVGCSRGAVERSGEGLTLSDFLLREVRILAQRPGAGELAARLARREPIEPATSPAEAVRAERDGR